MPRQLMNQRLPSRVIALVERAINIRVNSGESGLNWTNYVEEALLKQTYRDIWKNNEKLKNAISR